MISDGRVPTDPIVEALDAVEDVGLASRGSNRPFCAIVEPTADLEPPLGCNTDLVQHPRICPKPIGNDAARSPLFLHDPLGKLQRRGFVSFFTYKGRPINVRKLGHELNVRYVLKEASSAQSTGCASMFSSSRQGAAITFGLSGSARSSEPRSAGAAYALTSSSSA